MPRALVNFVAHGCRGRRGQAPTGHACKVEAILPRTEPPPSMTSRRFPRLQRCTRPRPSPAPLAKSKDNSLFLLSYLHPDITGLQNL
jgi:hypothetical protein